MDSALVTEIIKGGGLMGVVYIATVIPLAWFVSKQAKELKEVQDVRAKEAQQVTDKLISLNNKWNETIQQHIRTVDTIDTTMQDVKTALGDLGDNLRTVESVGTGMTELKVSVQSIRDLLMQRGR
jgi:uncharacterized protein YoxC